MKLLVEHTTVDFLCKAEIHELEMTICINEDVLRLKVSICDALMLM
jgi:hypothetical protein